MSRSHTYVSEYTTKDERFGVYGILKREKQSTNISEMGKYEIRVPKPRILVQGVLCRYGRKEHESNKRIYREPVESRQRKRPNKYV